MRGDPHQRGPLADGLAPPPEVSMLQVSQATVDGLRAVRRRHAPEVISFQQCHPQTAHGRVPRDCGAVDACADHDEVEPLARKDVGPPVHARALGFRRPLRLSFEGGLGNVRQRIDIPAPPTNYDHASALSVCLAKTRPAAKC